MNRRKFNWMGATSLAAITAGTGLPRVARAGVSTAQADQLKTTLTPFGAKRAGNADGSIPAWTGGLTQTLPGWIPDQPQPDYFASDAPVMTINQSNMTKYADLLSIGLQALMTKYDYSITVYPTHRTSAAPQYVYDNTYQNALNSALDPRGGRFGFSGAYGGIPFPILDPDPDVAGPQIIWNNITRWVGHYTTATYAAMIVSDGSVSTGGIYVLKSVYPYYDPNGSLATFDGWLLKVHQDYLAPAISVGSVAVEWTSTNSLKQPTEAWILLNGQGRVRKAPELTYDTPQSTGGGIINYDESEGFYGDPSKYNWKLLGKREMYVPYNNNKWVSADQRAILKQNFVDPAVIRYEKHRVYVVDATLAPGERHTVPHRRFYVDEDNWHIVLVDEWDANGNLLKVMQCGNVNVPNLPGTIYAQTATNNVQTDQYVSGAPGVFADSSTPGYTFDAFNTDCVNPQFISASAQF